MRSEKVSGNIEAPFSFRSYERFDGTPLPRLSPARRTLPRRDPLGWPENARRCGRQRPGAGPGPDETQRGSTQLVICPAT